MFKRLDEAQRQAQGAPVRVTVNGAELQCRPATAWPRRSLPAVCRPVATPRSVKCHAALIA